MGKYSLDLASIFFFFVCFLAFPRSQIPRILSQHHTPRIARISARASHKQKRRRPLGCGTMVRLRSGAATAANAGSGEASDADETVASSEQGTNDRMTRKRNAPNSGRPQSKRRRQLPDEAEEMEVASVTGSIAQAAVADGGGDDDDVDDDDDDDVDGGGGIETVGEESSSTPWLDGSGPQRRGKKGQRKALATAHGGGVGSRDKGKGKAKADPSDLDHDVGEAHRPLPSSYQRLLDVFTHLGPSSFFCRCCAVNGVHVGCF